MMGTHSTDRASITAEDTPAAKEARALVHLALIARDVYMARRFITLNLPQTPEDDDALVAAFAGVLRTHVCCAITPQHAPPHEESGPRRGAGRRRQGPATGRPRVRHSSMPSA
jgi:hypothetical protein